VASALKLPGNARIVWNKAYRDGQATSLAAVNVGIHDRGRISVGAYADLVLFDPETIIDRATPAEPHLTSTGVRRVWVNGASVYESEHTTDARPGRVLKRVITPTPK